MAGWARQAPGLHALLAVHNGMALATQCPHCHTLFRVAHDQLKLRGGIVRCGSCNEIFDGNAALVDVDVAPPAASTPPPPAMMAALSAAAAFDAQVQATEQKAELAAGQPDPGPVYTIDLNSTFDPLGILPKPEDSETPAPDTRQAELPLPGGPKGDPDLDLDFDVDDEFTIPAKAATSTVEVAARLARVEPKLDMVIEEAASAAAPQPPAAHAEVATQYSEPAATHAEAAVAAPVAEAAHAAPAGHDDIAAAPPAPPPEVEVRVEPVFELPPSKGRIEPVLGDEPGMDSTHSAAPDSARLASAKRLRDAGQVDAAPMDDDDGGIIVKLPEGAGPSAPPDLSLELAPPLDMEEPGFVKRSRQQEKWRRTGRWIMGIGSVLLVAGALAQGVREFRNDLAAQYPQLRLPLQSACRLFACTVQLPTQISKLSIDIGELQTLPGGMFSLTTQLHNQSNSTQTWPHIDLTLKDPAGKQLLRRAITPADYLPASTDPSRGFPARTDQNIKLYFALDQVQASDYNIVVFYP